MSIKDVILQVKDGVNFFASYKVDKDDDKLIYIDVYEVVEHNKFNAMEKYELFMKAEYFVLRDKLIIREQDFSIDSYNASEMLFTLYHIMRNIDEY